MEKWGRYEVLLSHIERINIRPIIQNHDHPQGYTSFLILFLLTTSTKVARLSNPASGSLGAEG